MALLMLDDRVHSWFDARNPVVKMNGSLRSDLYARMCHWASTAHVVLALGTSLSGLAADMVPEECARRASAAGSRHDGGLVIVALQRTRLDGSASLRIFAKLDDIMERLARRLERDYAEERQALMRTGAVDRNQRQQPKEETVPPVSFSWPTDAEVAAASRHPEQWYANAYRADDKSWTRETRAQCLARSNPS
mmetsp:Transcript_12939/g.34532  ORF Transcript_12939/g.34532 Transcript_12939/m.34532 type:complete len:193 (+) Transcript_12939:3448-4026(+)